MSTAGQDHYQTVIRDISGRKKAKETLRERARLLDLTHDTVFVRNMNNVITYWNRGAEELYGWTREEAVGQVSQQLTRPIFQKRSMRLTQSCSAQVAGKENWTMRRAMHAGGGGKPLVLAAGRAWQSQRNP